MAEEIKNYKEEYKRFFKEYSEQDKPIYMHKLQEMVALKQRSFTISHKHLYDFNPKLADLLIRKPEEQLAYIEEALKELITYEFAYEISKEFLKEAKKIYVRIKDYQGDYKPKIREIRAEHLGSLIEIKGIVTKCSAIRYKLIGAKFYCEEHGEFEVYQDPIKKLSYNCPVCGNMTSKIIDKVFLSFQKIIIQELLEEAASGQIPRTLEVYLEGDLVDVAYPGNQVTIIGILKEKKLPSREELIFSSYVHALGLEVNQRGFEEEILGEQDEEEIKKLKEITPNIGELIVDSIAPSIYGLTPIKKALALQLFGGVHKVMPDGIRVRGDINILLVGDPGTAKTQLLRYMAQLAPKGIYTSGKGVSAAGLTAAVVKDKTSGEFYLEAGALVLADQGLAAIDEIDKMRGEDRVAMHEAMEQQTISIAKAGIVATLNARCAILAAANPALGRFEKNKTIVENINLPVTLLSRFDLIFPIIDIPSAETDAKLAQHVLAMHTHGEVLKTVLSQELIKKYLIYARRNVHPKLSKEAQQEIYNFYLKMRDLSKEGPVAITPRQLEALIRLTEAHARMYLREEATAEDAQEAIALMKIMMREVLVDVKTQSLDVDIVMTGIPKSRRDKLSKIMEILSKLGYDKEAVAIEDVYNRAESEGMSIVEAETLIKKLINDGFLYSPKPGFIKKA